MEYKFLIGKKIKDEIDIIKQTIDENPETIFIFNGSYKIHEYIDFLTQDDSLEEEYIYKFKLCYEKTGLNLSLTNSEEKNLQIVSMSDLIQHLNKDIYSRIVVNSDSREDLAFIVQQLIYIQYPIVKEKIDILLRKEEKDANRVKRFTDNINALIEGCNKGLQDLIKHREEFEKEKEDEGKAKRLKDIDDAIDSCKDIGNNLEKANHLVKELAVTASKKTGKSVIVNCFIGEEIAPTSIQLATPNNCIYRKSPDNLYHLEHDGKNDDKTFNTRKEIYDAINKEFKDAEKDVENDFKALDMNIGYVTDENNFSSYTIYDTPGPDAAGTGHGEKADQALQKCNVAIFAIDYAKYLTDSEEKYLKKVKQLFESQNKFHTLMFALNKIDVRFNDTDNKSVLKAVDFIKNRLSDIDKDYRDCIIFPTCSLEYFYAIDADKKGAKELTKEIPIDDIGKIRNNHRDIKCLQQLKGFADNLGYYYKFDYISYDIFKKDSGIPALMNYVDYIATSKFREEVLNSVASKIEAQRIKLKGIFAYISNLEKMINMGDEQIKNITKIIEKYKNKTSVLLNENFTKEDLSVLDDRDSLKKTKNNFNQIIKEFEKDVDTKFDRQRIVDCIFDKLVELIFSRIKTTENLDQEAFNNIFTATDCKNIINEWLKVEASEVNNKANSVLKKIGEQIKRIIERRIELLDKYTSECRKELEKENVPLEMIEMPAFSSSTPAPSFSDMNFNYLNIDVNFNEKLKNMFKVSLLKSMMKFYRINTDNIIMGVIDWLTDPLLIGTIYAGWDSLSKAWTGKATVYENENLAYGDFYKACDENLKKDFRNIIYDNDIDKKFEKSKDKIEDYMIGTKEELDSYFKSINDVYLSAVERFSKTVDDREKYKKDNIIFSKHKAVIKTIMDSTSEFMKVWGKVADEDLAK